MNIEVFLMEAEIAQEFADSIEARDLPEKFFYLFPRSVRAWLELSQNSITSGLRRIRSENQMHGTRNIGFYPHGLDVGIFGR